MVDRGSRYIIHCPIVNAKGLVKHQHTHFVCVMNFVKAFAKVRHNELMLALDGIDVM